MPIQPFATQIQPPQIQPVNAMAQVGQLMAMRNAQQENALRNLQMGQLKQGIEQENALRAFLGSGADLSTPEARRQLLGYGESGIKAHTALRESDAAALTQQKAKVDLADSKLKQARTFLDDIDPNSPTAAQQFIAWHEANHRDPVLGQLLADRGITAEQSRASIDRAIQQGSKEVARLIEVSKLGLEKFTDLEIKRRQEGRAQSAEERAKSAEERAKDEEDRKRIEFERKVAAEDLGTYNADANGFISSTTGKFTPLREVQETKEVASARKALAQIGYDPKTASDMVTDLIKNSTGSLAGTWVDSLARSVGMGTAGAQNIESLAAIANQMALDLAGGKLGAGFSNEDRDFLRATLGDVANPRKTRSERLAAWNVARDRLIKRAGETKPAARGAGASGSWDAPESKTGGASAQKPAVRSGVTSSGVKFTVEED